MYKQFEIFYPKKGMYLSKVQQKNRIIDFYSKKKNRNKPIFFRPFRRKRGNHCITKLHR